MRTAALLLAITALACGKTENQQPGNEGGHVHNSAPGIPGSTSESRSAVDPEHPIVHLPEGRAQQIGIKTDVVQVRPYVRTIRASGVVRVNERTQSHVHLKYSGFVERVYADFTGKAVQRGQPLFSIYSPDLFASLNEYLLLADRAVALDHTAEEVAQLESVKRRLALWDLSPADLDRVIRTRAVPRTMDVRAPLSGTILEKKVLQGMAVEPGMELYVIADLSIVWVLAQVYESDLPFLRTGQPARLTLDSMPGSAYQGRITFIDPTVSESTRTTGTRMEFANAGQKLRPGMYATVEIAASQGSGPALPAEAVIDTGKRKIVFVMEKPGEYHARDVVLGVQSERYFEVISGVKQGDRIVTSGQFLLDSEAKLQGLGEDGGHKGH